MPLIDLPSEANNVLSQPIPKPLSTNNNLTNPNSNSNNDKEPGPGHLTFPLDLSQDYTTDNIIRFTINEYLGGGYNRLNKDGLSDNAAIPTAKKIARIYLAMPSNISTGVDAKWSGTTELFGTGLGVYKSFTDNIASKDSIFESYKKGANDLLQIAMNKGIGNIASYIGIAAANTLMLANGKKLQPYEEQLFENTTFRQYQFNFKLIPRSAKEIEEIAKIVTAFRWAASPGIANLIENNASKSGTNILSYPNTFEIKYLCADAERTKLVENKWLNKIQPSICTNVNISFSSADAKNYLSYSDKYNGAPIYYDLSLKFTELVMVTKDAIGQGY